MAYILMLVSAFFIVTDAIASGHIQTSTVEGVTITIQGQDTEQGKKDVASAKKALDDAATGSQEMKNKIKDAGGKFGNKLTINVSRDNDNVTIAERPLGKGEVNVDLGDIDKFSSHLTSEKADKEKAEKDKSKFLANLLIDIIAHEIDHARDGTEADPSKRKHADPPAPAKGQASITGPAVDDANKVLNDLKANVVRAHYLEIDKAGKPSITYMVDKQKVTVDVSGLIADILKKKKDQFIPTATFVVDPQIVENLPGRPCETSDDTGCFPPACGPGTTDSDCDGISDSQDNCIGLANPGQADNNSNGSGQGCDTTEPYLMCDTNYDRIIDRSDIADIFAARNLPAGGSDPRDPDADGLVTINDARACALKCTNARCAP